MPASNYLRDKLLDHVLRSVAYTDPATVYFALFTTATDADNNGTECADGSYARQAIAFDAAVDGVCTNSATETVTLAASADFEGWGIFDASTAGNLLFFDEFSETLSVGAGTVVWGAGDITQNLT